MEGSTTIPNVTGSTAWVRRSRCVEHTTYRAATGLFGLVQGKSTQHFIGSCVEVRQTGTQLSRLDAPPVKNHPASMLPVTPGAILKTHEPVVPNGGSHLASKRMGSPAFERRMPMNCGSFLATGTLAALIRAEPTRSVRRLAHPLQRFASAYVHRTAVPTAWPSPAAPSLALHRTDPTTSVQDS